MTDLLFVAILSGLAGMFGWGFADFFAKKTIDRVGDLVTLAWAHLFGLATLAILVIARAVSGNSSYELPTSPKELGILAFFGFLQALVYFFAYRAFSKGTLSLLNPIFSSYSGIVVLLSVVVFGEILGGWQLACLALVFSGIIAISLDPEALRIKKLKLSKLAGMREILTAAIMAALWTVLWGNFVSGKDWLVYAALMYFFMSASILFFALFYRQSLKIKDRSLWKFFGLIGLAEVVAYVGVSIGYSFTSHTSIVAVLSAAFSLPTLVLAYFFLKERITRIHAVGVALVIAGVVLISII